MKQLLTPEGQKIVDEINQKIQQQNDYQEYQEYQLDLYHKCQVKFARESRLTKFKKIHDEARDKAWSVELGAYL